MNHKIKTDSPRKAVQARARHFELLQLHFSDVCEPYKYFSKSAETDEPIVVEKFSTAINMDQTLL